MTKSAGPQPTRPAPEQAAPTRAQPNHSLIRGMSSSAMFGIAGIVSGIALLPLVIATVGAGPYGAWLLLVTLATYLYQADLGMGSALVHYLARDRGKPEQVRRTMTAGFVWMTVSGIVALPIYLAVAVLLVEPAGREAGVPSHEMDQMIVIGGVLIAVLGFRSFSSALQGSGYWVYDRGVQTGGVVVRIVATVIACLVFDSVVGVALAEALALLTPTLLAAVKARQVGLLQLAPREVSRDDFARLGSYGLRSFAVGALGAILLQADTFIVGIVASAAAVTYYTAAWRVYMSVRQIIGWVVDPLAPTLAQLYRDDLERAKTVFQGLQFATLWLASLTCVGLALASTDLISLWLGDGVPTSDIAASAALLLLSLLVASLFETSVRGLAAAGRPGAFIDLYVWWCIARVTLGIVLGKSFGIAGVAAGALLPLLVLAPFYVARGERFMRIARTEWLQLCLVPVSVMTALGLVGAGVGYGLASAAGLPIAWLVSSIGFGLAYLGASYALRSMVPVQTLREASKARV